MDALVSQADDIPLVFAESCFPGSALHLRFSVLSERRVLSQRQDGTHLGEIFKARNQPWLLTFFDSAEDRAKIRQAIKDGSVHVAVARSTESASGPSQTTGKKRKASFAEPSFASISGETSTAVMDTLAPRVPNAIYAPTASQMIEAAEEAELDAPDEEPPERLYTTLNTSVVGVQYYKGDMRRQVFVGLVLTTSLGLVGYGERVKLVREPNNHYDR